MKLRTCFVFAVGFLASAFPLAAQTSTPAPLPAAVSKTAATVDVPRWIRYTAQAQDQSGKPLSGVVGVTFALYRDEHGGAPLWVETQNVHADAAGRYTALLGSTTSEGVPLSLFSSAEAHWIGIQISGQAEQPRALLLSVPYALKALDAETLGGMPASAFVQANQKTGVKASSSAGASTSSNASSKTTVPPAAVTGAGTANYVPLWTGASTLGNSIVFQTGGNVGVGTTTPDAKVDATSATIAARGTTSGATGTGVFGRATSATGANFGVQGTTASSATGSAGVAGTTTATTGTSAGVLGKSSSPGAGVLGMNSAATGVGVIGNATASGTNANIGVKGVSLGGNGTGVVGTGPKYGMSGTANNGVPGTAGVIGKANNGSVVGVYGVEGLSAGTNGVGVFGCSTLGGSCTTLLPAGSIGVEGISHSVNGYGVYGSNTINNGVAGGVYGVSASTIGSGVFGANTSPSGVGYGVQGNAASGDTGASGVFGFEGAATGQVYGVSGGTNSSSNAAAGVSGFESSTTGVVYGVTGGTNSTTQGAAGVNGFEGAATGYVFGVFGGVASSTDFSAGVGGSANSTTGQVYGVVGVSHSTTNGSAAVNGYEPATTGQVYGVYGSTPSVDGTGVQGFAAATSGTVYGVFGGTNSPGGAAVGGYSGASSGGTGASFTAGATSGVAIGVFGQTSSPAGAGAAFTNLSGGTSAVIVGNGAGYKQIFQVDAAGDGFFAGNLNVTGKVTKGSGSFKIDHPLDPANKYLSHSFVESPDMMNVYNGNITTDRHGLATIVLPAYFEALNRDFRYQLTVIGQFAQAIVQQEIAKNRFTIKTSKPSVKVSWQVTGIRHDAYADADRIPVEEDKPLQERGHYLHPELFGATEQQAAGAAAPPVNPTAHAGTN
jgi:hypothetical protein